MKHNEFSWQGQAGQKIFAQQWQPDEQSRGIVALVHGLGEHSGRYQHVAGHFTQAGYALVGFDLPGHGRTEGPRGLASYAEISKEIDHLVEHAVRNNPGVPCFIYGHSMGGALVLYYVLNHCSDFCGAIVTSPGLEPGTPVPGAKVWIAKKLADIVPALTMSNGLDVNNLSGDPAVARAYKNDPLVHDRVSARLGRDILTLGAPIIAQAHNFPIPLLLMHGSIDRLASLQTASEFARNVPAEKITFRVWEGMCHELHNEIEQDKVIQKMIDWLNLHI